MDIPLPRRKQTWRDSTWWCATKQALISCASIIVIALPIVGYLASQLRGLSYLQLNVRDVLSDLVEGGLLMLPYLWAYFFALERLATQKNQNFSPPLEDRQV